MTVEDKTFSLNTFYKWNYITSEEVDEDAITIDDKPIKIKRAENLPFSHVQIAFATKGSDKAFLLKNDPSSRKLTILDRRRRDVKRFEMISEDLFLIALNDEMGSTYWTLLDKDGKILEIPKELEIILHDREW